MVVVANVVVECRQIDKYFYLKKSEMDNCVVEDCNITAMCLLTTIDHLIPDALKLGH